MTVTVKDNDTYKTDTRSDYQVSICAQESEKCSKFSVEFMSSHKVTVYLAR